MIRVLDDRKVLVGFVLVGWGSFFFMPKFVRKAFVIAFCELSCNWISEKVSGVDVEMYRYLLSCVLLLAAFQC